MDRVEELLFSDSYSQLVERMRFYRSLREFRRVVRAEHSDPELTLRKAAAKCGVSPRHLNRRLIEATGLSYLEFLTRYRLRKAVQMMQRRDYSLTEISLETGFGSLSGFQRQFKTVLGRSPRQLRSEMMRRGSLPSG
jgi:two-component system, response regulator YesN